MKNTGMKLFVGILLLVTTCFITSAIAVDSSSAGIGARLFKDGRKCFVIYIIPESAASKAFLPLGAEILQVNGTKVNNLSIENISEMIRGARGTTVELLIKNNGQKETYKIVREEIVLPKSNDSDTFNLHWRQVAPEGYENVLSVRILPQYSSALKQYLNINNYWATRKENFRNSFNVCQTYKEENRDTCYMNLVNREISQTNADEQAERQAAMMQMQSTQNFVNTMNQIQTNTNLNNINNSIQQQNMQLWNINNTLKGW